MTPPAARFSDRKAWLLDLLSPRLPGSAPANRHAHQSGFQAHYEFRDDADLAALFAGFLDQLPDGGLIMCHPGFVDADLQRLDPLTTLREREYAFLAGESFPTMLAAEGVTLT